MESPRVLVFGYSDVGHACLKVLLQQNCRVVGVFTHEDNPNENQWFPSVSKLAEEHHIPVFKPEKITRAEHETLIEEQLRPWVILSFYYRNMLPEWLLEKAALGAFNLHGSYLPKYRGRAPVNWAVLKGETQTGATLHHMVDAPDAGDIVDQEAVTIGPDEPAIDVMRRVRDAGVRVLERQVQALLAGTAPRIPQDESQATYFGGRRPEDGRIDWYQDARAVHNLVRAVTHPYPGAFCDQIFPGQRTFIWRTKVLDHLMGQPGEILSQRPLIVAAQSGAVEVLEKS
ncbi:MAG: formyltransferase [Verrucomicrobiota bacterium]